MFESNVILIYTKTKDSYRRQSLNNFGYESEMILQCGGRYKITKIEKKYGKIYVDMEHFPNDGYDLIQQDPNEWKGRKDTYKD